MLKNWIALAAALALAAGATLAIAATTDGTKAAPVPVPAPAASTTPEATPPPGRAPKVKMGTTANAKAVNLNSASLAELKALPGGSDKEAAAIVAGRPYNSKADLVSKNVIDSARYSMIKRSVVAGAAAKPAAAAKK